VGRAGGVLMGCGQRWRQLVRAAWAGLADSIDERQVWLEGARLGDDFTPPAPPRRRPPEPEWSQIRAKESPPRDLRPSSARACCVDTTRARLVLCACDIPSPKRFLSLAPSVLHRVAQSRVRCGPRHRRQSRTTGSTSLNGWNCISERPGLIRTILHSHLGDSFKWFKPQSVCFVRITSPMLRRTAVLWRQELVASAPLAMIIWWLRGD